MNTISIKEFDCLDKRDFENQAVLNEIRTSLKQLEQARQLLGAMADLAVTVSSFRPAERSTQCKYCNAKAATPDKLHHLHMCLVARARDLLKS